MAIKIFTDGATEGANGKLGTVEWGGIGFFCKDDNYGHSERIRVLSNNEAEFIALIRAMDYAYWKGYQDVEFYLDSQVIVRRAQGHRPIKIKSTNERMDFFQREVRKRVDHFKTCTFNWISRWQNETADMLSKDPLMNNTTHKDYASAALSPRPRFYDYH